MLASRHSNPLSDTPKEATNIADPTPPPPDLTGAIDLSLPALVITREFLSDVSAAGDKIDSVVCIAVNKQGGIALRSHCPDGLIKLRGILASADSVIMQQQFT